MITIVLLTAGVALLGSGLWLVLFREPLVTAWWYRIVGAPDPYDAGFAEAPDPIAGQYQQIGDTLGFGAPVIPSDHPTDCAELCCWEARLTEMHDAFDWSAREHEMRSKR